jgi:hypothetical protein
VCLAKTDNAIRDTSGVSVMKNSLQSDQITDHQQLLVDVPTGGQKAASTRDHGIDARQISLPVVKLLLDGLAYHADPGLLLFRNSQKLGRRTFLQCVRGLWPKTSLI